MKIRILLVDDHTILRAGLKMMLNAQPDMDVVGEAHDGRQASTRVTTPTSRYRSNGYHYARYEWH